MEAQLVERLRRNGHLSVSLVAEFEGQLIGHVAFSPVTAGTCRGAGLAPLAVAAEFRRQGAGAALVRHGLAAVQDLGFPFAVVLGDPAYYARFGFLPASRRRLSDEFGGGDAFQVLEWTTQSLPAPNEVVRFSPEFDLFR